MVQIIQENRRPSFAERMNQGLGRGLEAAEEWYNQNQQEKKDALRKQQMQQLTGMEFDDPELQKLAFQMHMQKELQKDKQDFESKKFSDEMNKEKTDKMRPLQGALSSIDEMLNIRNKGNLGAFSGIKSFVGRGDTARDKGAYETLGNSLISFATNIPIRNRVEFEKLAGHISDSSISDAEAEGILMQLRKIVQDSMSEFDASGMQSKEKPSLDSFFED